ncbi:MAG: hypothetical protein HY719_14580 [Planctomycetes bacterium]|nr:hypothetical protein [Planctomycetota bacterium]
MQGLDSQRDVLTRDVSFVLNDEEIVKVAFLLSTRRTTRPVKELVAIAARFLEAQADYQRSRHELRRLVAAIRAYGSRPSASRDSQVEAALRDRYRDGQALFSGAFRAVKEAHRPVSDVLRGAPHPFGAGASRDELKLILNLLRRRGSLPGQAASGAAPAADPPRRARPPAPAPATVPAAKATELDAQVARLARKKSELEEEIARASVRLDALSNRVVELEVQLGLLHAAPVG